MGIDASDHYSGDATLFELGCYMYFRLDFWLYQNKPNCREEVSTTFMQQFIKLFTQALGDKNVPMLFAQRVAKYGELAKASADVKKFHHFLSQLILQTKDNKLPEFYDFKNAPLMLTGILEDAGLKISLVSWEQSMIPALVKSVECYCDLTG